MIALAMLYATAVGACLAGAAWLAERAAVLAGRATRGAWAAAMLGTLVVPAAAVVGAHAPAAASTASAIAVVGTAPDERPVDGSWTARVRRAAAAVLALRVTPPRALAALDAPLGLAWAAAAAVLLLRHGAAVRRLQVVARRWPARDVDGVRVRVAPDLGPAVVGVRRPWTVLPAWVLAWPAGDPRTRLVLRHEAEHARARDPLLLAAATLAVVLVPWNAALWWQRARLRGAVEVDCDRRVLVAHGGADRATVARYGRVLLEVAARTQVPHPLAPALAARCHPTLERRIRMMTTRRPALATLRASVALAATAAVGLAALALPRPALARDGAQPPAPNARAAADSARPVLYVVDGRELPPGDSSWAKIPPADIATVNVHKGGAVPVAYAARGRNGVVVIVTKKAATP